MRLLRDCSIVIYLTNESIIKRVLIDQAELDRMRARQVREYSPEIQTMARLQDKIINILGREDLTADEKLSMISIAILGSVNYVGKLKFCQQSHSQAMSNLKHGSIITNRLIRIWQKSRMQLTILSQLKQLLPFLTKFN